MKKELEIEQLCAQLDKGESIRKKELEIDQRVDKKMEKFADYDFENAGDDISKNEIEAVFANFKKSLEGMKSIKDGDTDGFIKSIKDGGGDGIFSDLGKRCGLSLGAVLHYHNLKKNCYLNPEEILVSFSYATYMIDREFWNYFFDEKKLYPLSLRREQYNLGDSFESLLKAAMISSARYIMHKDFENDYFEFYSEYEFDKGVYEFWQERADLKQQILSVRKLIPSLDKRSFIYGYDRPEEPDTYVYKNLYGKEISEISTDFTDYAFVRERLLRNPKEDPIQFLKDTKFLYTPIFVRFFFKPEIDK